jgi:hypothetical protein
MKHLIRRLALRILVICVMLVLAMGIALHPGISTYTTSRTHAYAHINCAPTKSASLCGTTPVLAT